MISWLSPEVRLITSLAGLSLFATLCAAGTDNMPSAAEVADGNQWVLHLPEDEHVNFQGMASFDNAGVGTSSFTYVAPNAGGFLAAVLTHGLVVDSAKKKQKDDLQTAADQVLIPYKAVIEGFGHPDLMRRTVERSAGSAFGHLVGDEGDTESDRFVDSVPLFTLTPDQKTLILDNEVVVNGVPAGIYRNSIRIISSEREVEDPVAFWTNDDGKNLKNESARLEAESLHIALQDATRAKDAEQIPFRTVRYREGASEKFERAQVLAEQCERLVIRTLRGTLMSVPTIKSEAVASSDNQCQVAATAGPGLAVVMPQTSTKTAAK